VEIWLEKSKKKVKSRPHRLVVGMKEKYGGRWMWEKWISSYKTIQVIPTK
jgi:hypothetical protein